MKKKVLVWREKNSRHFLFILIDLNIDGKLVFGQNNT